MWVIDQIWSFKFWKMVLKVCKFWSEKFVGTLVLIHVCLTGSIELGTVAKMLDSATRDELKSECGGVQTLLRNHNHIFQGQPSYCALIFARAGKICTAWQSLSAVCCLFAWISLSGKVSWNNYVLFQIQYQERKVYRLFLCVSVPGSGGGGGGGTSCMFQHGRWGCRMGRGGGSHRLCSCFSVKRQSSAVLCVCISIGGKVHRCCMDISVLVPKVHRWCMFQCHRWCVYIVLVLGEGSQMVYFIIRETGYQMVCACFIRGKVFRWCKFQYHKERFIDGVCTCLY